MVEGNIKIPEYNIIPKIIPTFYFNYSQLRGGIYTIGKLVIVTIGVIPTANFSYDADSIIMTGFPLARDVCILSIGQYKDAQATNPIVTGSVRLGANSGDIRLNQAISTDNKEIYIFGSYIMK